MWGGKEGKKRKEGKECHVAKDAFDGKFGERKSAIMCPMKIILATGIYPPAIGGPATYVRKLAEALVAKGDEVSVITFAAKNVSKPQEPWPVEVVKRGGGPILRWWRYSRRLRKIAKDADIVYAFSAVSVGMPLLLAHLKKPKKILRLGGDFCWERYTDWWGKKTLRQWYAAHPPVALLFGLLLRTFDYIVFSTVFQEQLYRRSFKRLPRHSVIENALPAGELFPHTRHEPFRLLFMGRFVRFKNLRPLLRSVADLPHVTLALLGEGPAGRELSVLAEKLRLKGRIVFLPPVHGEEKAKAFREYDVLVLPSLTEISPNVALEARASGLPVLLTEETGLSDELREGMLVGPLRKADDVTRAVLEVEHRYDEVAALAASPFRKRGWEEVAAESRALFTSLP